jgi:hypothetical protein
MSNETTDTLQLAMQYIYEYYPTITDAADNAAHKAATRQALITQNKHKNRKKLYQIIDDALPTYPLIDNSDDLNCLYYSALLHANQDVLDNDKELLVALGGIRFSLYIYCSMIAPFFLMCCDKAIYDDSEQTGAWAFYKVDSPDPVAVINAKRALFSAGYQELSIEDARHPVPDVETEYSSFDQTIVFDCLFEGLISEGIKYDDRIHLWGPNKFLGIDRLGSHFSVSWPRSSS